VVILKEFKKEILRTKVLRMAKPPNAAILQPAKKYPVIVSFLLKYIKT
jgi:hypothetical protein